ncbi:DUF4367 domain-containing protein [Agathobaculum sp. NTUH-O15-33]|uniref:DUF4367 domain-containing protein n=1 Tax=Agathobaculum sp. NTUH-O15-33 TaxID=3079302 RepID=UPI002958A382|nr:DUF4367 domain-containing protein [Agathobaculum sp. NTUH-O15-33]WNX84670.1 DUF4367 domain-containing protein [Agathobaculum sp. NTUH-O15-33]
MSDKDSFDKLIEIALDEYVELDENCELKTEEELRANNIKPHVFSLKFEKQMKRLIHSEQRRIWWVKHRSVFKRLTVCLVILITIGGVTIANVDAFRISFLSFFLQLDDTHSKVEVQKSVPSISNEFNHYLPTYVPNGFAVSSVQEYKNDGIDIEYVNDEGQFYILQFKLQQSNASIDTENAYVQEFTIQGTPALITEKDNRIAITWGINEHMYHLTGYISKDEAVKILESIDFS